MAEDNIKTYLKGTEFEDVNWIHQVETVMNLRAIKQLPLPRLAKQLSARYGYYSVELVGRG